MDKDHTSRSREANNYLFFTSLKNWSDFLIRKWWIITLTIILGLLSGFLVAYFDKPKFESRLTFALEAGEGALGGALSFAADFGFNIGSSNNLFEGDNILALLNSRRIIERVLLSIDTFNGKAITMADYYKKISKDSLIIKKENNSPKKLRLNSVSFPIGQPRSSFSYLQDSVLMNICNSFSSGDCLRVGKPDKKLNLYEVIVISNDERFSKVFTDKLIKEAIEFYTELQTKKSKETLDILEERVAKTKGSLNSSISTRANIQDANVNPIYQQAQAQIQKQQVDISAYGGAYSELYKNLELARYQYLKDIPLLQVVDGAEYPMKYVKKGKLKTGAIYGFIFGLISIIFITLYRQYLLFKGSCFSTLDN